MNRRIVQSATKHGRRRASVLSVTVGLLLWGALLAPQLGLVSAANRPSTGTEHPPTPDATITSSTVLTQPVTSAPGGTIPHVHFFPWIIRPWQALMPFIERPDMMIIDISPADGETDVSPNTNFRWTVETDINVDHYRVYADVDSPMPETLIGTTTNPFFDPPTFDVEETVRWRIAAVDGEGTLISSPVFFFSTEGPFAEEKLGSMVEVPAGEFLMGCDRSVDAVFNCLDRELPLHAVYLNGYEIDKYEVTNREYQACVAADACDPPRRNVSRLHDWYYGNPAFDLYPVIYVSWWNAQDYCGWQGKRLPTEAEWEKAARGDMDTRTWPWGEEAPDCSRQNFTVPPSKAFCAGGDTIRVGTYPPGASPYGAMDMSGNVFEWVYDRYEVWYYRMSPYENPTGPDWTRDEFVIRGGSFQDNWWYTRVVHRHYGHHGDRPWTDSPHFRNRKVGFRCARSLVEGEEPYLYPENR